MKIKTKLNQFNIDSYIKSCGLYEPNGLKILFPATNIDIHKLTRGKIVIIQDSDMDGVMSAVIMYNWLKKQGYKADVIFHTKKQHGLDDVMEHIVGVYDTVIVPDAGSADVKSSKILDGFGQTVIVFDHHEYDRDYSNPAIIYNCKDWNIGKMLSGGAVVNYCLEANQIDLAACSIISDVMPLNDAYNRYIIKNGLLNITNPFLKYLVDKLNKGRTPNPKWISWTLSPLINAVCRSDNQEAKELIFRAFVNEADFDKALAIMRKCHRIQKTAVDELYEELYDNIDDEHRFIVVMAQEDSPYNGLVANKLLSKFNRPIIILRDIPGLYMAGSMRSPVPILSDINDSGLAKAQGHQQACGILIHSFNLQTFLEWSDRLDIDMNPPIEVACMLNPNDINIELCEIIQNHNDMYGAELPEPLFYSKFRVNNSSIKIFRRKNNTLRIDFEEASFILFKVDDGICKEIESADCDIEFEVTYNLSINEYMGSRTCQCLIKDFEYKIEKEEIEKYDFGSIFK